MSQSELPDGELELVSTITEFNDLHDFMQDQQLDRALYLVVKIIVRQADIPREKIPAVIVELQALATKFALLATYYATIGKDGTPEMHKKNIYNTARDAIGKLVDSLKYRVKEY